MHQRALPATSAFAASLLDAVHAQDFGRTADGWHDNAPLAHFPSIDLAVAAFPRSGPPRCANVLFSREHPAGVAAVIGGSAGPLSGIRFDADMQDAQGDSIAWRADADWSRLPWRRLWSAGDGAPLRFVAPYPASLLKLMVAVGVGLLVDRGRCDWPPALEPMIVVSDNDATSELVALLHRHDGIALLHERFALLGLPTLQLRGTRPDGRWRNADGAGVGQIQMTAWDTVRLLWLLDAEAPRAPWLAPAAGPVPLLQSASRDRLRAVLARQQLDHILSSGAVRGEAGWVAGLPDAPAFAHKTGSTDNYAADAGIVRTADTHYIVAALTSLGRRYAASDACATTWRLPALGAALHRLVQA